MVTPRPARTESLAELLQQYQALAGRTTERSELITDVAALAGQRAKPEEVAGALGRMFSIETNPVLKSEILEELGALDHPSAINPILAALQAGQPTEVQADAADAVDTLLTDLAFSENAAMIEPISRALDSRYPSAVRQAAVSALEDLESPAAIPVLQRYLNDPDPEVREAAADAIEWLTE